VLYGSRRTYLKKVAVAGFDGITANSTFVLEPENDELMPELLPFTAGIEAGADAVMTAHIAMREGDPPASLDRRIVTGLLRERMGFGGLVITDALEMAGALPDGKAMSSIDPASGGDKETATAAAAVADQDSGITCPWRQLHNRNPANQPLQFDRTSDDVYKTQSLA
jgi:hypothetical protein